MLQINRIWAMPNKDTFSIKPIKELIDKYFDDTKKWIDPFVGNSSYRPRCYDTNDLNPNIVAAHHWDGCEFLKRFEASSIDGTLFDPPYSPRQVAECYKSVGRAVTMEDTQARFWSKCKQEIARIMKFDGIAISCGWNSSGIGKTLGFELIELLLVCHGGQHNDTIVTVEKKVSK